MLGIPGADDNKTEKFLFIKTKGSNLLADAYFPHSFYFYDTVTMYIGL